MRSYELPDVDTSNKDRCRRLLAYDEKPEYLGELLAGDSVTMPSFGLVSPVYYGLEVELEIHRHFDGDEVRDYLTEAVTSQVNCNKEGFHFVGKHDGSMGWGIEFVSNPMTISKWNEQRDRLAHLSKVLRPHFWVSSKCGIHIHISKDGFVSPAHLENFLKFVRENKVFIWHLSRRGKMEDLREYANLNDLDEIHYFDGALYSDEWQSKYMAVRPTKNTIEVRIFRSTMNLDRILGYLQVCDIMRMYTLIRAGNPRLPNTPEGLTKWAKKRHLKWLKTSWAEGVKLLDQTQERASKYMRRREREAERRRKKIKERLGEISPLLFENTTDEFIGLTVMEVD